MQNFKLILRVKFLKIEVKDFVNTYILQPNRIKAYQNISCIHIPIVIYRIYRTTYVITFAYMDMSIRSKHLVKRLQRFYLHNCWGDYEHRPSIKIDLHSPCKTNDLLNCISGQFGCKHYNVYTHSLLLYYTIVIYDPIALPYLIGMWFFQHN